MTPAQVRDALRIYWAYQRRCQQLREMAQEVAANLAQASKLVKGRGSHRVEGKLMPLARCSSSMPEVAGQSQSELLLLCRCSAAGAGRAAPENPGRAS